MKYYTIEIEKKSVFKTFAIYYICMAVFCTIRIISTLNVFPSGVWGSVLSTLIIQTLILFLLPLLLYCFTIKVTPRQVFKTCNFYRPSLRVIAISIAIGFVCFFINIAVSSFFNGILTFTGYRFGSSGSGSGSEPTIFNFFLDLILVALLPAFCEEFLHRGLVLQGIKHIGFKKSIVISSVLFALLHFNIQQVSYAFVIGLILGFVSVVSKNIYPAIIIHFVNNAISTYIDYASIKNWVFGDALSKLQTALLMANPIWVFIVSAIVMIGIVVLLCLLIWILYKQSILRKVDRALDEVYKTTNISGGRPVQFEEQEVIRDLLEKNTLLNLDYKKMDSPIDMVLPKEKSRYKMMSRDKIFLWGAIVLGGLITFFTYVWGLF